MQGSLRGCDKALPHGEAFYVSFPRHTPRQVHWRTHRADPGAGSAYTRAWPQPRSCCMPRPRPPMTCALDGVAAGEDAGDAGAADLIRFKQAASVGFQILGAVGDRRTGALADGDNNAVRRVELLGAGDLGQRAVLGLAQIDKDNALIGDFQRLLLKIKLTPSSLA